MGMAFLATRPPLSSFGSCCIYLMDRKQQDAVRHIALKPDRRSAHDAREFVHQTLTEWGCDGIADEVTLAVSELVTNAVIHAHSAASLTLIETSSGIQVRVQDNDPEHPTVRWVAEDDFGGRGMHIVDALSDSWGIEAAPPGKIVWLDISKH